MLSTGGTIWAFDVFKEQVNSQSFRLAWESAGKLAFPQCRLWLTLKCQLSPTQVSLQDLEPQTPSPELNVSTTMAQMKAWCTCYLGGSVK